MIELQRTYRFCASHVLAREDWTLKKNLEVFGTASNASGHGHNYRLTVIVAGEPDAETARVVDLDALDAVVAKRVIDVYDHRNLNRDVNSLEKHVPTTETILRDIRIRTPIAVSRRRRGGFI